MELSAVLIIAIGCIGFAMGYLAAVLRHGHTKEGTPSASHNRQRSVIFLPRYADEDDNPYAFNDAYNFHADCGDR